MTAVRPVQQSAVESTRSTAAKGQVTGSVPLWTYFTESPRDFGGYTGVMVGRDPFNGGGSVSVSTKIVPLVFVTHQVATGIGSDGHYITTAGDTTFDPTVPDNSCLAAPSNVPATLVRQSPLFENAGFNFGGTDVGKTQYVDAFQKAEFWTALGDSVSDYHTYLGPVEVAAPILIDVPPAEGLTRPAHLPGSGTLCGPQARVNLYWFDAYLNKVVIPSLSRTGLTASTLPVFVAYNTVWAIPPIDPKQCCVLGYHSGTNTIPIQTYAVGDFEETGYFRASLRDTAVLSHELAEWVNDPFGLNLTPAWGNTGQVAGCQNNLEVGDPLTGSEAPRIAMPNGFTYHLQEMAFFSWFYGAPSIGINGWFSNNGTFLSDAGPVCQPASSVSSESKSDWIIR